MFDINTINNIKDIEDIKVDILQNISQMYENLKISSSNDNVKDYLTKNIELTKELANKLNIEI